MGLYAASAVFEPPPAESTPPMRPGRGAANHIAGTFAEQLARARCGRRPGRRPAPPPALLAEHIAALLTARPALFRPVLLDLLRPSLETVLVRILDAYLQELRL